MKCFLLSIILISFLQQGIGQFIYCGSSFAKKYSVTARSGLKLRVDKSLDGKVITVIPNQSEVRVCYEDTQDDLIDGTIGKWVKAFWKEKEGYVFDYYLEIVEANPLINLYSTELDLVNDWGKTHFSKKKNNYGLFRTDNNQEFELRKIKLKQVGDDLFAKPINQDDIPICVFNESGQIKERLIKGREINRMIFLGEKISIKSGTLYSVGKLIKKDSISVESITIDPYELRFQYRVGDQIHDQLLLKMNCWSGIFGRDGYEAKAVVNFIGDLDGDFKDDILITFQSTYKGWYYGLFSTRYAVEGDIFKEIIVGQGSE